MQLVVDQLLTNYEVSGQGKTIVVLHGWGDSAAAWRPLIKRLEGHYQVAVPDLPGFGGSQPPTNTWGLSDYAQFVANFLAKTNLKPYAIIGHSNGGAIAIRGLGKGILKADKLVLMASSGIRDQYRGRNKAIRLVTKTGKLLTRPLPKRIRERLRRQVYQTVGSDMLVAEHLQETFKQVVTDDVQADAAKIKQPTLILYGAKDTATPPAYGERFQHLIKGSSLAVLPTAGHFVYGDQPDEVTQKIEEFLR